MSDSELGLTAEIFHGDAEAHLVWPGDTPERFHDFDPRVVEEQYGREGLVSVQDILDKGVFKLHAECPNDRCGLSGVEYVYGRDGGTVVDSTTCPECGADLEFYREFRLTIDERTGPEWIEGNAPNPNDLISEESKVEDLGEVRVSES